MNHALAALVAHLDAQAPAEAQQWHGWQICPVEGGANNRVFRATHAMGDYAVKLTVRDDRDRAGREYAALAVLAEAGVYVAPRPVWLELQRFRQPVVVQTWVDGPVVAQMPTTDADWNRLLDLYCAIHRLTPADSSISLPEAVLNVSSGSAGKQLILQHLERIPAPEQPPSLQPLVCWLEHWEPPVWEPPPRALCRVDSNWRNFIQRDEGWVAVDWENSGWGDPAFELAELVTHPAYADTPAARWEWLIPAYAERMQDTGAMERIAVYTVVMEIWWAVRWARYLYEVPRGLDPRLVERPPTWHASATRSYERSLARVEACIRQL